MSGILNFPDKLYFRQIQTGAVEYCGRFDFSRNIQLTQARLFLYKEGAHGTTEFRLSAYSDADLTRRLFSSDWCQISAIDNISDSWLGYICPTFTRRWVNKEDPLYFAIETQNYTMTPTFSLNFCLDWPFEVNDSTDPTIPPVRVEFFGLEDYTA